MADQGRITDDVEALERFHVDAYPKTVPTGRIAIIAPGQTVGYSTLEVNGTMYNHGTVYAEEFKGTGTYAGNGTYTSP